MDFHEQSGPQETRYNRPNPSSGNTNRSLMFNVSNGSLYPSSLIPSPSTSRMSAPLVRPLVNQSNYLLTLLCCCHPSVSVCYGCSKPLKVKGYETPAPFDLVVVSQMRREFRHDGKTMNKLGNVYFHANIQCLRCRLALLASIRTSYLLIRKRSRKIWDCDCGDLFEHDKNHSRTVVLFNLPFCSVSHFVLRFFAKAENSKYYTTDSILGWSAWRTSSNY